MPCSSIAHGQLQSSRYSFNRICYRLRVRFSRPAVPDSAARTFCRRRCNSMKRSASRRQDGGVQVLLVFFFRSDLAELISWPIGRSSRSVDAAFSASRVPTAGDLHSTQEFFGWFNLTHLVKCTTFDGCSNRFISRQPNALD